MSRTASTYPTPDEINALPEKFRQYIHDLETRCDKSGDVQTIAVLREDRDALHRQVGELESELKQRTNPQPKSRVNVHCPVRGCKTTAPHTNDPLVQHLLRLTTRPALLCAMALGGLTQLRDSISSDVSANRIYGWLTRMRQIEELYTRALYLLLVASPEELPHFFSEAQPNGFSRIYREVNEKLLGGTGLLEFKHSGEDYPGEARMMDIMNHTAHCSFRSLLTAKELADDPHKTYLRSYLIWIDTLRQYLSHIIDRFNAGQDRATIADHIRFLHAP